MQFRRGYCYKPLVPLLVTVRVALWCMGTSVMQFYNFIGCAVMVICILEIFHYVLNMETFILDICTYSMRFTMCGE